MLVPVVTRDQRPLMPTTKHRAMKLVAKKEASPFWKRGIWCIRLNKEPSGFVTQTIVVGIDPGSKREGFTVKSETHTYLNIQATAVGWVKDAVEQRRNMRRARRFRNTPCRKNRSNRNINTKRLPPSTKARWQWKLRICEFLKKLYPIMVFVVEDIKASSRKGCSKWNKSFSPLQVGKQWFYSKLGNLGKVMLRQGYETAELRNEQGLKKISSKLAEKFSAHCVDSWVLANWYVGGHDKPDNEEMLIIEPIQLHRRQLHALQPATGGIRKSYGSTRSMGFKRGGLASHPKWGKVYIGGTSKERISLHCVKTGERLCRNAKPEDTKQLTYTFWRSRLCKETVG